MHLIAHAWFPRVEYGRIAPDRYGLERAERERLAAITLDSIVPFSDGTRALQEAHLPDGRAAFGEREVRHLRDVRRYLLGLYGLHAMSLVALVALAVPQRTRPILRDGLAVGALLTLGVGALVGVYLLVSPVSFLGGFHRVFFSGSSWRFAETDTLRRLFPDRFWSDTAAVLGGLTAIQAALLLAGAWLRRRQAIRPPGRTPPRGDA